MTWEFSVIYQQYKTKNFGAINGVKGDVPKVVNITNLTTTNKNGLVSANNKVKASIPSGGGGITVIDDLLHTDTDKSFFANQDKVLKILVHSKVERTTIGGTLVTNSSDILQFLSYPSFPVKEVKISEDS